MGSRSKTDLAYIAGFLDGDGSLMLQIKKRKDGGTGIRFMSTICFYQDTRHEKTLHWIRSVFKVGYLSQRGDGITELRINGYKQVKDILASLMPYVRFKKKQAECLFASCTILCSGSIKTLSKKDLKRLVALILAIQNENYATRKKKTEKELYQILGLTP